MNEWLIAFVFSIPLVAFGMWLTFNAILVKWHGLEALKTTPSIYRVFDPRSWNQQSGGPGMPPPPSSLIGYADSAPRESNTAKTVQAAPSDQPASTYHNRPPRAGKPQVKGVGRRGFEPRT
jgi:hypothetical protein